jgi:uncharacterized protein (TIGR03382 family)
MRLVSLLLISLSVLVSSRPADACSPPMCWPGAFLPGDATTIPSNAPGLYWRPSRAGIAPSTLSTVRLTTTMAPTTALSFTATPLAGGDYVIVPDAPLVEGTSYVLEDLATCGGTAGPRVTFTAGPSAPLPASLGTMWTDPHGTRLDLEIATSAGSCSMTVDAETFGIGVTPSTDATPWMALLLFETVVDGQPWQIQESINYEPGPGESWKGRGRDLLFRICTPDTAASYTGMSSGGHAVAFRASLPGGQPLATPALGVELMCDPDPDPKPVPLPEDDGGCSSTTPTSWAVILFAFAALRRRRRR